MYIVEDGAPVSRSTAMAARVLLFVVFVAIGDVVGEGCGPHEVFRRCGPACQRSCERPNPSCGDSCVTGCFCAGDRVRDDDTQLCVEISECPSPSTKTERSHHRRRSSRKPGSPSRKKRSLFKDPSCKENEEFKLCETCYRSCDNPQPSCSDHCERGCFCTEGLLRDRDGRCVTMEECSGGNGTAVNQTCGPHKVFQRCRLCEKTCNNPSPACGGACRTGCFCEEGYLKHPNGHCVRPDECPKEVTVIGVREPSVEECGSDEEFLSCGWCEPSCSQPAPRCPAGACARGCLCRPPLLRHRTGHCVRERDCTPRNCPDPSEEYVCRYGCEPRCDNRTCAARPRICALGCHCRLGLRRRADGRCVTADRCRPEHRDNTTKAVETSSPHAVNKNNTNVGT